MDPIEPSNQFYGVGNNAFVLEMLSRQRAHPNAPHPNAPRPIQGAEAHAEQIQGEEAHHVPEHVGEDLEIDHPRLSKDQQYLNSTLENILYKARFAFRQSWYQEAERLYQSFFSYRRFYANLYLGFHASYYPAFFEFSWLMDVNGKRKEAEKFMNEQLLNLLEVELKSQRHHAHVSQQYIHAMQEREQLPTRESLQKPVSTDTLVKLAKLMISQGEREMARHLLAQIEVRNLVKIFRSERMIQQLYHEEYPKEPVPKRVLPLHYEHVGLPVAPWMPPVYNANLSREAHDLDELPYYTDLVEPVRQAAAASVGQNPNRPPVTRKRRVLEKLKKLKPTTIKTPPPPPPEVDEYTL